MKANILDKILYDNLELIGLSRRGVDYALFESVVSEGPFSLNEWSHFLHLPKDALQNYAKEGKSFSTFQSERILEIARLQHKGADIFGNVENFTKWMNADIIALGNVQPKTLLDNSFGISLVNAELVRIEHGVLA